MCLQQQNFKRPITIAITDELNDIVMLANLQRSTTGRDREARRRTRQVNIKKVHSRLNHKISVTLLQDTGRPTGPYATLFVNDINLIVRKLAPLNVEKWADIESTDVAKMIERITSKFDINISLPWVKRYAIKMFRAAFLKFRYGLKKHFDKFSTVEEALENKPEAVKTQEEWDFLCTRFSSQELQINSLNARKKLHLTHHNAWSKYFMAYEGNETATLEGLKEHAKRLEELNGDVERFLKFIA